MLDGRGIDVWLPAGARDLYLHSIRNGSDGPSSLLSLSLGAKLTRHLHLVLRLRICGTIPPLLHMSYRKGKAVSVLN
jgi:hypothetical protein